MTMLLDRIHMEMPKNLREEAKKIDFSKFVRHSLVSALNDDIH
jgi:hypothetical protein